MMVAGGISLPPWRALLLDGLVRLVLLALGLAFTLWAVVVLVRASRRARRSSADRRSGGTWSVAFEDPADGSPVPSPQQAGSP